jgi:glycosyltransferase involved in cell wall biosynthesis
MNVALLSPCFWPEVRRGGERFVRELADGLLARGQHPSLITSHPGLPSREVEQGLPVTRLPRPPQGRLLRRRYIPYLTHVPLSYAALQMGSFDVAHAVYATDALAAARWRRKTGRPALFTHLGIPDRRGLCEHRRHLDIMLRVIDGCDAVVALSQYAADAFRHWLGYEPRVIAPGVDVQAFQPAPRRSPQPTIICSAAPEIERKHVGLLIDAFGLVREELPEARLVLSRPRDPQAVRSAGIDLDAPGVEWANLDDRAQLARAYGEAWVAALPSRDEAFGLVLAEALACGTPVVGYAHAAIPEIVNGDGTGRLFDRLEPEALAVALLDAARLAEDPQTVARCRARAEQLSTARCTDEYLALYRELLGESS